MNPLLKSLGWLGDFSYFQDYLPVGKASYSLTDYLIALSHLKIIGDFEIINAEKVSMNHMPALFLTEENNIYLILEGNSDNFRVYNPKKDTFQSTKIDGRGILVTFKYLKDEETLMDPTKNWFIKVFFKMRSTLVLSLLVSFIISMIGVLSPVLIILIFGQINVRIEHQTFIYLGVGLLIFLLSGAFLQIIRTYILANFARKLGYYIGNEVIRRILLMPSQFTENASVSAQISRIRDFDSIQGFFSSYAFISILEQPFIIFMLGVQFIIEPIFAFINTIAAIIFMVLTVIFKKILEVNLESVASVSKEHQSFLLDSLNSIKSLRALGYGGLWLARYEKICQKVAAQNYLSERLNNIASSVAFSIVSLNVIFVMAFGVDRVLQGNLSPEYVIVGVMITWKVMGPLRNSFRVLMQIDKIKKGVKQIDRLMHMNIEQKVESTLQDDFFLGGNIEFSRVSMKYSKNSSPAILNISFALKPGETLVILGGGGSGKTTIFKALLGLISPQTGRMSIDGLNIRQMDPQILRRQVSYMPEKIAIFEGSIRDNLMQIKSRLDQDAIVAAMGETGIENDFQDLNIDLDSSISSQDLRNLPNSILKRLGLSMLFLKESEIWLLDEPGVGLEDMHERQLLATLDAAKGAATTIIATQNEDYLEIADYVLLLDEGHQRFFGSVHEFMKAKTA